MSRLFSVYGTDATQEDGESAEAVAMRIEQANLVSAFKEIQAENVALKMSTAQLGKELVNLRNQSVSLSKERDAALQLAHKASTQRQDAASLVALLQESQTHPDDKSRAAPVVAQTEQNEVWLSLNEDDVELEEGEETEEAFDAVAQFFATSAPELTIKFHNIE
eukprot:gene21416-25750_t